jgi:hypothetical protein
VEASFLSYIGKQVTTILLKEARLVVMPGHELVDAAAILGPRTQRWKAS